MVMNMKSYQILAKGMVMQFFLIYTMIKKKEKNVSCQSYYKNDLMYWIERFACLSEGLESNYFDDDKEGRQYLLNIVNEFIINFENNENFKYLERYKEEDDTIRTKLLCVLKETKRILEKNLCVNNKNNLINKLIVPLSRAFYHELYFSLNSSKETVKENMEGIDACFSRLYTASVITEYEKDNVLNYLEKYEEQNFLNRISGMEILKNTASILVKPFDRKQGYREFCLLERYNCVIEGCDRLLKNGWMSEDVFETHYVYILPPPKILYGDLARKQLIEHFIETIKSHDKLLEERNKIINYIVTYIYKNKIPLQATIDKCRGKLSESWIEMLVEYFLEEISLDEYNALRDVFLGLEDQLENINELRQYLKRKILNISCDLEDIIKKILCISDSHLKVIVETVIKSNEYSNKKERFTWDAQKINNHKLYIDLVKTIFQEKQISILKSETVVKELLYAAKLFERLSPMLKEQIINILTPTIRRIINEYYHELKIKEIKSLIPRPSSDNYYSDSKILAAITNKSCDNNAKQSQTSPKSYTIQMRDEVDCMMQIVKLLSIKNYFPKFQFEFPHNSIHRCMLFINIVKIIINQYNSGNNMTYASAQFFNCKIHLSENVYEFEISHEDSKESPALRVSEYIFDYDNYKSMS